MSEPTTPTIALEEALKSEITDLLVRLEKLSGRRLELLVLAHDLVKVNDLGICAVRDNGEPNVEAMLANAIVRVALKAPKTAIIDKAAAGRLN